MHRHHLKMSATQNLIYSTIQVAHNLGAVAVVGGSLGGMMLKNPAVRKKLAWLVLGGWGTQALSGATFGAATYYFSHHLPDIGDIAEAALILKMICAAIGFILLVAYLFRGANWAERSRNSVWIASSTFAITALGAAAFLRWFS